MAVDSVKNVEAIKILVEAMEAMQKCLSISLIGAERLRQIDEEGHSLSHDDLHDRAELASAGVSYAQRAVIQLLEPEDEALGLYDEVGLEDWPWSNTSWKPSRRPIDNLVKAAALLAAEIDRLVRIERYG